MILQPDWPAHKRVRSLVTTRIGGVSVAPYDSLNLGRHVGDAPTAVMENRARLRRFAGLPAEPCWLEQVHGTEVIACDAPFREAPRADGAFSATAGVVLAIMTADCLPILLADRHGERVAALHAGWRGLVEGIIGKGVDAMGLAPARLQVYLGPAIGPRVYEVGEEVRRAFLGRMPTAHVAFRPSPGGRWLADLYALARLFLAEAGIAEAEVYGGMDCTYEDAERFYSYRRDKTTGRMATLIWIED